MVSVERSVIVRTSFPAAVAALAESPGEVFRIDSLGASVAGLEVSHPVTCVLGWPRLIPDLSLWTMTVQVAPTGNGDGWFPRLDAMFEVRPVDAGIELTLEGSYTLPAGLVGWMADRILLHRVAEASVERYLHQARRRIEDRLRNAQALTGVPV